MQNSEYKKCKAWVSKHMSQEKVDLKMLNEPNESKAERDPSLNQQTNSLIYKRGKRADSNR